MHRLVLVCLFVLTSLAWVPSAAAQGNDDDLPTAPQSKGDGLEFSVEGAIIDDAFGSPLNWGANEDGRLFLLVTIEVENTSSETKTLNSNNFRIIDGIQFIAADDGLSKRPEELGVPAMGDVLGDTLAADATKLYILGWRLEPSIDEYVLDIDYGSAKTVDLQPWLDLDISPRDLRPSTTGTVSSNGSSRPSNRPTATATATSNDDDEITSDEQDYLDAIAIDSALLGDAGGNLSDLFGRAADNEYLVLDPDWLSDVGDETDIFRGAYTRAQNLEPSDRQAPIQEIWLSLTAYTASAADNYELGLTTLDPSYLTLANTDLENATDLTDDLIAEVEAFTDDPASYGSAGSTTSGNGTTAGSVTDCTPFADYDEAQEYYANNPDAQPIIDPDFDGLACEVYFGRG